jgi:hypothetical protein
MTTDATVTLITTASGESAAQVTTTSPGGGSSSVVIYTQSEFIKNQGNFLRSHLASLNSFGYAVQIEGATKGQSINLK